MGIVISCTAKLQTRLIWTFFQSPKLTYSWNVSNLTATPLPNHHHKSACVRRYVFCLSHLLSRRFPGTSLITALTKCMWSDAATEWMGCMSHRKRRETKQQPIMLPGPAVPGCCLVSFGFLCDIHSIHSVQTHGRGRRRPQWKTWLLRVHRLDERKARRGGPRAPGARFNKKIVEF